MTTPRVSINEVVVGSDGRSAQMTVEVAGRKVVLRIVDSSVGEPVALVFADGQPQPLVSVGVDSLRVVEGDFLVEPLAVAR